MLGECKICGLQAGVFNLFEGVCKSCLEKENPQKRNDTIHAENFSEDTQLYTKITKEVDSDKKVKEVWVKAIVLAEGDEQKAKYKYIKLRVEQEKNKLSKNYGEISNEVSGETENNNSRFLIVLIIVAIFIILLVMLVVNTNKIADVAPDCTNLPSGGVSCIYPDGSSTTRF